MQQSQAPLSINNLRAVCTTMLALLALLHPAAARAQITHDLSFDFEKTGIQDDQPIHGKYLPMDAEREGVATYPQPLIQGPITVSMWFRVDRWPDNGAGTYDDNSPMTLFILDDDQEQWSWFLRLNKEKLFLAIHPRKEGKDITVAGMAKIELNRWYHVAFVDNGSNQVQIYFDGKLDAQGDVTLARPAWKRIQFAAMGTRRHLIGSIDEINILRKAASEADIRAQIASVAGPDFVKSAQSDTSPKYRLAADGYTPLRVGDDVLHPFQDQLHIAAAIVPWYAAGSFDVLAFGHAGWYDARPAVYRFLSLQQTELGKVPVFDGVGTFTPELRGTNFENVPRSDGLFDVLAQGDGTVFGGDNLVLYRNQGSTGSPKFNDPQQVFIGDKTLAAALPAGQSISNWSLDDVDQDGTPDLLVNGARSLGPYWPFDQNVWRGIDQPDAGPGKGYDIRGNWLGQNRITELFWAKGQPAADGSLAFAELKPVFDRIEGYPFRWVAGESERAVAMLKCQGESYIVCTGDVDQIVAARINLRDGQVICDAAQPLLQDGFSLKDTYFVMKINTVDLEGDGHDELILDGNPGTLAVLKGETVGQFQQLGQALMKGGYVGVQTLTVPCRIDWDGDNKPDLILGDSSGYLTFWPGTDDPMVYGTPRHFTCEGKIVHQEAGMTGSIQGPNERRWGYLQPTVGDWDDDGTLEIITNNTSSQMLLYRSASSKLDLQTPILFAINGKPLPVAWRSRPAVLPSLYNFANTARPCLLYLDWDGDLAVAVPRRKGDTDIERSDKLSYEDGSRVRLCGPTGFWGRAKLAVCDWNGDGKWDVLVGTNRACLKFIDPALGDLPGATPMWLENVGTNDSPRFKRPVAMRFSNGRLIDFGVHTAACWPCDMNGDGQLDLVVGAEDGKVYRFLRSELSW